MISFAKRVVDHWMKLNHSGGLPLHLRNVLSVVKYILVSAAVTFTAAHLAHASQQHSGAECYHNGRRLYVPNGLNYPRQAWASWGISCRTPEPAIAAGSGATIPRCCRIHQPHHSAGRSGKYGIVAPDPATIAGSGVRQDIPQLAHA